MPHNEYQTRMQLQNKGAAWDGWMDGWVSSRTQCFVRAQEHISRNFRSCFCARSFHSTGMGLNWLLMPLRFALPTFYCPAFQSRRVAISYLWTRMDSAIPMWRWSSYRMTRISRRRRLAPSRLAWILFGTRHSASKDF